MENPMQSSPPRSPAPCRDFSSPAWFTAKKWCDALRSDSAVAVNDPDMVEQLLTPPKPHKDTEDDFFNPATRKWDADEPSTWPILCLPFHMTPSKCAPTHIDEVLMHVHYKGAGARALRQFLFDALEQAEAERDKQAIELLAYLCWPCNVTADGHWKDWSGMSEEEVEVWKKVQDEISAADNREADQDKKEGVKG